jgi:chromosome segregation ATPase
MAGAQEHSAQGGQSAPPSAPASNQSANSSNGNSPSAQAPSPQPESLAEAARKARQEKKAAKPARVFTNDNIPTSGGISSASSASSAASASGESENASADAASSPKDEKAWRDKFAQLHQKLDRDKESLEVMQRELGVLNMQYYSDPVKAMQQEYSRDDINKKTADIEAKKKDIEADQQAIDDAEDDLRKAGGDPGWAR